MRHLVGDDVVGQAGPYLRQVRDGGQEPEDHGVLVGRVVGVGAEVAGRHEVEVRPLRAPRDAAAEVALEEGQRVGRDREDVLRVELAVADQPGQRVDLRGVTADGGPAVDVAPRVPRACSSTGGVPCVAAALTSTTWKRWLRGPRCSRADGTAIGTVTGRPATSAAGSWASTVIATDSCSSRSCPPPSPDVPRASSKRRPTSRTRPPPSYGGPSRRSTSRAGRRSSSRVPRFGRQGEAAEDRGWSDRAGRPAYHRGMARPRPDVGDTRGAAHEHGQGHSHSHAALADHRGRLAVVLAITVSRARRRGRGRVRLRQPRAARGRRATCSPTSPGCPSAGRRRAGAPAGHRRTDLGLPAGRGARGGRHRRRCCSRSGGFVLVESVRRLIDPPEVTCGGDAGLRGRGPGRQPVGDRRARRGRGDNLNMRAAFLEVVNDALGSVAVLVAAVLIATHRLAAGRRRRLTADRGADHPAHRRLLRESVDVLMEATPKGLDLERRARRGMLRIRTCTTSTTCTPRQVASGLPVLTAHVVVDDSCFHDGHLGPMLDELQQCLVARLRHRALHASSSRRPPTPTTSTRPTPEASRPLGQTVGGAPTSTRVSS